MCSAGEGCAIAEARERDRPSLSPDRFWRARRDVQTIEAARAAYFVAVLSIMVAERSSINP
jgi:hypothetical protein